MTRHHLGDRVTILTGHGAGTRGTLTQRAHPQVRPHLEWIVTPDGSTGGLDWIPVHSSQLGPWTAPPEARPYAVGAMAGGAQ